MTLYVGAMSGTSLDGIDIAVVDFEGPDERPAGFELRAFRTIPYGREMRRRLRAAIAKGSPALLCELDFSLGRRIGQAVLGTLDGSGIDPTEIRAVGSHGQTVWHAPPDAGRPGSTLQLGSAAVIAETTGIAVISDFRSRDMAAGGQGAPLTAWTDWILLRGTEHRVIQNIGGMANLTWLPAEGSDGEPVAFDTGPGVALLDAAVERLTEGRLTYDEDGRLAAGGTVNESALGEWLADPYFAAPAPKSTGRERFSESRLDAWLTRHASLAPADVAATLTELTAASIATGILGLPGPPEACYLCGGGARNPALVDRLRRRLTAVRIESVAALGMDPDAREAIAFALLARQHDLGLPSSAPWATGASGSRVLGSRTPA